MFKVHQLHPSETSHEPDVRARLIWGYDEPRETTFWGAPATRITIDKGERIYVRETPHQLTLLDLGIDENE